MRQSNTFKIRILLIEKNFLLTVIFILKQICCKFSFWTLFEKVYISDLMSPWLFSGVGNILSSRFFSVQEIVQEIHKSSVVWKLSTQVIGWLVYKSLHASTNNIYKFDSDFCGNLYPINFNSSGAMKRVEATGLCENDFSLCWT